MDPMAMLDMERRSGISNKEVDDFVHRMDAISEAMEQIKAGTFDPSTCKVPGYKTPEQEELERQEKIAKEVKRKKEEEEKKRKAKEDEHENWWRKAKLRFSINSEDEEATSLKVKDQATKWANRVLAAYKARDANDYSMWDNWVPEDPATLEEKAAREAALESLRNAEFEKNNPEFCDQFKQDLEKRQQTQRERERTAEKHKLTGNRHYKRKEYQLAIDAYMKALDLSPFYVAVLTNIAQCYLRLECYEDSVEFSTRALYVNPCHVKALSRRAAVWHIQHKWKQAAEDMNKAIELEPENADVVEQHSIIVGDYEDSLVQDQLVVAQTQNEELQNMSQVLSKMDEYETADKTENRIVHPSWVAYQLVQVNLEQSADARALFRTSGALIKLADRLVLVLADLEALIQQWEKDETNRMQSQVEELTLSAMLQCIAASLLESPRNQLILFRHNALRELLLSFISTKSDLWISLSHMLHEALLSIFEGAIEAKAWKKAMIVSSPLCISTLLKFLSDATDTTSTPAMVSASSLLMTLSGDDQGLEQLAETSPFERLEGLTKALSKQTEKRTRRLPREVLRHLLGILVNLSTNSTFRELVESDSTENVCAVRTSLTKSLLYMSTARLGHTKPDILVQDLDIVVAERAMAALLNCTHQARSLVRKDLVTFNTVQHVEVLLRSLTQQKNPSSLLLVFCRVVSLLCRLHPMVSSLESLRHGLCASSLLDQLYAVCHCTLSLSFTEEQSDKEDILWQLHAQIWCHLGWCLQDPTMADDVRQYLDEKQAVPAILETLERLNSSPHLYRRLSSENPKAPERGVGNMVKVLIATLTTTNKAPLIQFWTNKPRLRVLVTALQVLPDGVARKNVAIVLAKLCQLGDTVKDRVRDLRGIEMMLSVSKSLESKKSSNVETTSRALAF